MTGNIFTALGLGTLSALSVMAFLTMIVVEVLKQIVPKKFPTKALTVIVALLIAVIVPLLAPGAVVSFAFIATNVLNGFIVAFISMNGFDSLKDIWERVKGKDDGEE